MSLTLPACGLHYGVSFAEYSAWDAINFSRLKAIRNTASKCKWEMEHPKQQTPAMILGNALHTATLEPARFEAMFHICPACDRRTKEGKEMYAEEERKAEGKILIREGSKDDEAKMGQVEIVRGMAKAIHASQKASLFISGQGQNEVSMLWRDPETGLMCKGRCDRITLDFKVWDCDVIVELKSDRDAREFEFARSMNSRGYAAQAANYCFGYEQATKKRPAHVFIVVENFPPHDLKVYLLDDASMQTGLLQYRQMLNRYAECVKSGKWPGYEDKITTLKLPDWANEEVYA